MLALFQSEKRIVKPKKRRRRKARKKLTAFQLFSIVYGLCVAGVVAKDQVSNPLKQFESWLNARADYAVPAPVYLDASGNIAELRLLIECSDEFSEAGKFMLAARNLQQMASDGIPSYDPLKLKVNNIQHIRWRLVRACMAGPAANRLGP